MVLAIKSPVLCRTFPEYSLLLCYCDAPPPTPLCRTSHENSFLFLPPLITVIFIPSFFLCISVFRQARRSTDQGGVVKQGN